MEYNTENYLITTFNPEDYKFLWFLGINISSLSAIKVSEVTICAQKVRIW